MNLLKLDQVNILLINASSQLATLQGNLEEAIKLLQEESQDK